MYHASELNEAPVVAVAHGGSIDLNEIVALSGRAVVAGVDFIKTEHLCAFDGEAGFTLGQGQ